MYYIENILIKKFFDRAKDFSDKWISEELYAFKADDVLEVVEYLIEIRQTIIMISAFTYDKLRFGGDLNIQEMYNDWQLQKNNIDSIKNDINNFLGYFSKTNEDFYFFIRTDPKDIEKLSKNYLINMDGLILYGPYTSYSIYIDQDTDTKEYTIYLWKKDIENSSIEFKLKNKEELQKFFDDNDILVEWEENENI